jgi:hypothetical protein
MKVTLAVPAVVVAAYLGVAGWVSASMIRNYALSVGAPAGPAAPGSPARIPQSGPDAITYGGTPRDGFGYDYRDILVAGQLGDLPAYYVPPAGEPSAEPARGAWAIFVHGLAGTRQHGYRFLPGLHRAGFPTMLISYRNDPGTAADPSRMHAYGLTEWRDLDAAVRYALDHGAGSVLLAGESMGAAIIGQFLRRSARANRVSALVLDSPAVDMPRTIKAQAAARHVPFSGGITRIGIWLADRRFPVQLSQARSLTTMQGFPGPVFIAQGERDPLVPVGLADSLASGRAAPTTYLRTAGAGHGESYYADPGRYRRALAAFLAELPR